MFEHHGSLFIRMIACACQYHKILSTNLIFLFIITATATNTSQSSQVDLTITPPPKDGSE